MEKNVDGELAKPLIAHYVKMRTMEERLQMISALSEALSHNEDVLLCLSVDVYKAILNYLLFSFSHEKELLERASIQTQRMEQNEITQES